MQIKQQNRTQFSPKISLQYTSIFKINKVSTFYLHFQLIFMALILQKAQKYPSPPPMEKLERTIDLYSVN